MFGGVDMNRMESLTSFFLAIDDCTFIILLTQYTFNFINNMSKIILQKFITSPQSPNLQIICLSKLKDISLQLYKTEKGQQMIQTINRLSKIINFLSYEPLSAEILCCFQTLMSATSS